MVFLRWIIGPGASTRLAQSAPNEMVIPRSKTLRYQAINAGSSTAKVVRKPSASDWLKKKQPEFLRPSLHHNSVLH